MLKEKDNKKDSKKDNEKNKDSDEKSKKTKQDAINDDQKWIWLMSLKIPHKYKIILYNNLGLDGMYDIKNNKRHKNTNNINNINKNINFSEEKFKFSPNNNKMFVNESQYIYGELEEEYIEDNAILNIIQRYSSELNSVERKIDASKAYDYCINNNIHVINIEHSSYPESFKFLIDKPLCFLAKGNLNLLNMRKIGIVGARKCSFYGYEVTKKISQKLSEMGYIIVSGLAKGIDRSAHLAAMPNTIAVLGSGIDKSVFYPKQNYELLNEIIDSDGLVIFEYLPQQSPTRYTFPERNRIIAGLSEAIIVTEAKQKSGSLITAEFAYESGIDVYSVPGDILSANYDGTNKLIQDGAIPIVSIEELEDMFI